MNIDELFEKRLYELNLVFKPLNVDTIQLGRLIAFEIVRDTDGVRFHTSENIQEELGYSLEEFYLNLHVKDLLDKDSFRNILELFNDKVNKLRSDLISEFKFKDREENSRWGQLYLNISYYKREWVAISGYVLDITVRKEEEEKRKREGENIDRVNDYIEKRIQEEVAIKLEEDRLSESRNRHSAVSETIEKVAHQWRQPLNIISLLMQDLYFKINLGNLYPKDASSEEIGEIVADKYNELYDKVNSHIQYLSDTVDDFRKHISSSGSEDDIEHFNIKEFFDEIVEFVSPALVREGVKLTNKINIDFIEVMGIENNLKQVVLNIIHNAQDIFRERKLDDREILLGSYFANNKLCLTISDNAGGIPKDILSQIFDPYFTTRHETQGTGLGLYMSRELIHKGFNGEIYATNRTSCSSYKDRCSAKLVGQEGACFKIEIPNFREI